MRLREGGAPPAQGAAARAASGRARAPARVLAGRARSRPWLLRLLLARLGRHEGRGASTRRSSRHFSAVSAQLHLSRRNIGSIPSRADYRRGLSLCAGCVRRKPIQLWIWSEDLSPAEVSLRVCRLHKLFWKQTRAPPSTAGGSAHSAGNSPSPAAAGPLLRHRTWCAAEWLGPPRTAISLEVPALGSGGRGRTRRPLPQTKRVHHVVVGLGQEE
eukprot:scaffold1077_cov388-Prasinococcus_capsulatus_cf.AAC.5